MAMRTASRAGRSAAVLAVLLVLFPPTAGAQAVSVDTLLARVLAEPNTQPYTLTADFAAQLVFHLTTGRVTATAAGTLVESRAAPGEPRRRKATITRLGMPLLMRPFASGIRSIITNLVEADQRPAELLPMHDVFISEERAGGRFVLGGVRADIVTEVMTRYGLAANLRDQEARRAIARWLWSPAQRASIVRPGPGPYMITALVDDSGLIHQLTLAYDWGQAGNRVAYVTIGGWPFWREVVTDASFEFAGLGRVDGTMILLVSNHCLNCPPR